MRRLVYSVAIVFALISSVESEGLLGENKLQILDKALHESIKYMKAVVQDEDATILLGRTRCAKSTLTNYLIGNKLKAVQLSRVQITILKQDDQSIGPEIGKGPTSKTTIPTKWISKIGSIWDAPGFEDNRGEEQDIINAFYIYQLVQNVKYLKIVLVIDFNDILSDNIDPFLSVLKDAEKLLGKKMKDYFPSISVIFTKVPNTQDDIPVDIQYIKEKLSYIFSSSNTMKLSQSSIDFVQFLIENPNRIALFKKVTVGDVTSALDVNIFSVISNSESIPKAHLQKLNPSISEASINYLFKERENLIPVSAFNDIEKVVSNVCQVKIECLEKPYNDVTENEMKSLDEELTLIKNRLNKAILNDYDFYEKMEILQTIDVQIKNKIDGHNLLEKIKLMEFVDKLLGMEKSIQLASSLQSVLSSSLSRVKEAISSIQVKLREMSQQKQEENMRQERKDHQEQMNRLIRQNQELNRINNNRDDNALEHFFGFVNSILRLRFL